MKNKYLLFLIILISISFILSSCSLFNSNNSEYVDVDNIKISDFSAFRSIDKGKYYVSGKIHNENNTNVKLKIEIKGRGTRGSPYQFLATYGPSNIEKNALYDLHTTVSSTTKIYRIKAEFYIIGDSGELKYVGTKGSSIDY